MLFLKLKTLKFLKNSTVLSSQFLHLDVVVTDVNLQTISLFVNQLVEHRLLFVNLVQNS